jgi:hypothetical protein
MKRREDSRVLTIIDNFHECVVGPGGLEPPTKRL